MPKSAHSIVEWSMEEAAYIFIEPENSISSIMPAQEDWQLWLKDHHAFAFHGRHGQINLLKEKRSRGENDYWYAYQRYGKQMVKQYAGRSAQLNLERLEELTMLLAEKERTKSSSTVENPTSARSTFSPTQPEPLLMSRLQLPRLQKALLHRESLLKMLDQGLECTLTLISAPAGYGKTTTITQWITERAARPDFARIAYVALDEGNNDPFRFWHYIIAACQKFHSDIGKEALDLLLASRLPPFKPLDIMLIALLNDLSLLEQPCVLVLDDFHTISSPVVSETLSFFLDHLPISFHLFLLMRGDQPSISLTRLRARNELLEIYPPYLGFSLEETQAFFRQELDSALSAKVQRQIYEKLEGWPAGIRMFANALRMTNSKQNAEQMLEAFSGNYWSIRDYFFNEVLRALPEEQQGFLLQTCILPRLTATLCDAILERENSAQLIEALRRGDLFLVPLDWLGSEWFRYQTLFAEAIRQEARKRLGDERLHSLAVAASLWYEQHGFLAEAIETALNAATFPQAANLIQHYVESKEQSIIPTIPELYSLKRWLECLPEEILVLHPDLCLQYAMMLFFMLLEDPHNTIKPKEHIYHLLQVAEQKWRDANNTAKLAEVFSFRALMARQEGQMLPAITWAKQALVWLPPQDRIWRNIALTMIGFGEILDGQLKLARKYLLEALALSEQQGNLTYARATRIMLSWASFEQGELHHAAEQFQQIQAEARAQEDYDDIARTQLALARLAYQWNRLEEVQKIVQDVLEMNEMRGREEIQSQATAQLAQIEHAYGQTIQARQRLLMWLAGRATPITPHSYQLTREIQALLVFQHLANGDLISVERWFESIKQREEVLPHLQRQHEELLHARFLLAQGEINVAIEMLEHLSLTTQQSGHLFFWMEIQIVRVLAYGQQRAHEEAQQHILALLRITQRENYLRLYLDEGEEIINLVRGLLPKIREKTLLAYARRILTSFDVAHGVPEQTIRPAITMLLEPLSIQEQKVLRLLVAGNSNTEIARELVVSVNTIRTQVQSIYRKLNAHNRVEVSAVARRLGLV